MDRGVGRVIVGWGCSYFVYLHLAVSNASALLRHSIRGQLRDQIPSVLSYSRFDDSQYLSLLIIR